MILAIAAASAIDEPETPAIIVLVATLTCPRPPRRWPKRELAKSTSRVVMPAAFMIAAAMMKNGIASSVKELSADPMFCGIVISIRSPCAENAAKVPITKAYAIGTSMAMSPSATVISTQATLPSGRCGAA